MLPMALVVRVLASVGAVLLLALYLFSLLGRHFLVAELIGSFRYQLIAFMLPLAIISLAFRQRVRDWLLIGVVVWNLIAFLWIYVPASQSDPGPDKLKIMSLNLLTANWEFGSVIDLVRKEDPDVVMLLEYSNAWHKKLQPLHASYPHRLAQPRWHGYGIAAFSKRPIADEEVWQLTSDQTDVPAIVFRVDCGSQTIRLAGMHTMSPLNRYRLDLRNNQMTEIGTRLSASSEATVLMGDFNCTPWSVFMDQLLEITGYRDSRQGFGFQASWHSELPWLLRIPIDHVLLSPEVHLHSRRIGDACGSDHLPVIFEVSVGTD